MFCFYEEFYTKSQFFMYDNKLFHHMLHRLKPPFPADVGVFGCPTTVTNVENTIYLKEKGVAVVKTAHGGPKVFRNRRI